MTESPQRPHSDNVQVSLRYLTIRWLFVHIKLIMFYIIIILNLFLILVNIDLLVSFQ